MPAVHPRLGLTEFIALQNRFGWRLPLQRIGGEAVVVAALGGAASAARGNVFYPLRRWQEDHGVQGLLLQAAFVELPGGEIYAPDVAWWALELRAAVPAGRMMMVPDLVVKVLEPATRENDLGHKCEVYLRHGVSEMWLVDPSARQVRIAARSGGERRLNVADTLDSSMLSGFAVAAGLSAG